jgi:D-alanyl-D-alanine carboxypeptidase/D-alanyl-D-alanine-endopeptidase (penicillin-binding protein 4)
VRSGDDLCIVGTGDPGLGDERIDRRYRRRPYAVLDEWAGVLKQEGLTRIAGDLCYDESWFESRQLHDDWAEDDRTEWYACPVSGLNFNDNCIDVTVMPAQPDAPVSYTIAPPTQIVTVINECVSHGDGPSADIFRDSTTNTFTLTGRAAKRTALQSKPVTHPGPFLADAFRLALERHGITVAGELKPIAVRRDARGAPRDGEILAIHRTPLDDVLWRTNTHSQNLFAECLAKTVGRQWAASWLMSQPGSWDNARRAIPDRLRKLDVPTGGLRVADGSGLSHGNKVTARLITELLKAMHAHPNAAMYRQSLSKVGVAGTLRKRMRDLKGRVFAKTGYINSVRTLSGYVQTRDGTWLAFSFLYNQIPGSVKPFEKLQDEAVRRLAEWTPGDSQTTNSK